MNHCIKTRQHMFEHTINPGQIFAKSDIKAKIQPGVRAGHPFATNISKHFPSFAKKL